MILVINEIESNHFRTEHDTGANPNALFIWNLVRKSQGLPSLKLEDLKPFCVTHNKYHPINLDYGCVKKTISLSPTCNKCNVPMKSGIGLQNALSGLPDFPDDKSACTVSRTGAAEILNVWKCPSCGHSISQK